MCLFSGFVTANVRWQKIAVIEVLNSEDCKVWPEMGHFALHHSEWDDWESMEKHMLSVPFPNVKQWLPSGYLT